MCSLIRHWCFPVDLGIFSGAPILKNICERLLLSAFIRLLFLEINYSWNISFYPSFIVSKTKECNCFGSRARRFVNFFLYVSFFSFFNIFFSLFSLFSICVNWMLWLVISFQYYFQTCFNCDWGWNWRNYIWFREILLGTFK